MRNVMCFGDSNTHGTIAMRHVGDRRRHGPEQRWPHVMAQQLGIGWHVIPEGHPGRNAVFDDPVEGEHKNGLRILPALLESHRPLDLVIVMLGTNDLKARFSVPVVDIAFGLERLVAAIGASDAGPGKAAPKVLLAAPVPIQEAGILAEMFGGGAAKSRALPEALREVATRQGAGFVDLSPIARVDMVDGIHLSAQAHAAIGAAVASAVTRMFA